MNEILNCRWKYKVEILSLQGASLSGTVSPDGLKVKLQSTKRLKEKKLYHQNKLYYFLRIVCVQKLRISFSKFAIKDLVLRGTTNFVAISISMTGFMVWLSQTLGKTYRYEHLYTHH